MPYGGKKPVVIGSDQQFPVDARHTRGFQTVFEHIDDLIRFRIGAHHSLAIGDLRQNHDVTDLPLFQESIRLFQLPELARVHTECAESVHFIFPELFHINHETRISHIGEPAFRMACGAVPEKRTVDPVMKIVLEHAVLQLSLGKEHGLLCVPRPFADCHRSEVAGSGKRHSRGKRRRRHQEN